MFQSYFIYFLFNKYLIKYYQHSELRFKIRVGMFKQHMVAYERVIYDENVVIDNIVPPSSKRMSHRGQTLMATDYSFDNNWRCPLLLHSQMHTDSIILQHDYLVL